MKVITTWFWCYAATVAALIVWLCCSCTTATYRWQHENVKSSISIERVEGYNVLKFNDTVFNKIGE